MRKLLSVATILVALVQPAIAQTIQRAGRGDPRLEPKLDVALAAHPRVFARDTFIARGDTVRGAVLVAGSRLVLEGTILGDLTMVDANVYVRPSARIMGNVLNVGSGLYRSELATISGRVDDHPLAPYHVEREDGVIEIVGDVEYKPFSIKLMAPTVDRVNGIRPQLGIALEAPPIGRNVLELAVWGAYGFERDGWENRLQGGAEARLRRGFTHIGVGVEKTTATNDAWIKSDAKNALNFIWNGKDYRNYYEAERVYGMVARELMRGGHAAVASVRYQIEDANSLSAVSPWVLFKPDTIRPNPGIDDGTINSGILRLRGEWKGLTTLAEYDGQIEAGKGDYGFQMLALTGEWAMQALANHTLEIEARVQAPVGTDSLPRQRWGVLGGSSTIFTRQLGEFWGDRLFYMESEYSIPIDQLRLPILGRPALEFIHVIGSAWTHGQSSSLVQNVGAKIQFPFVYARYVFDPADVGDNKFSVGFNFPRGAYPWERAGPRDEVPRINR